MTSYTLVFEDSEEKTIAQYEIDGSLDEAKQGVEARWFQHDPARAYIVENPDVGIVFEYYRDGDESDLPHLRRKYSPE